MTFDDQNGGGGGTQSAGGAGSSNSCIEAGADGSPGSLYSGGANGSFDYSFNSRAEGGGGGGGYYGGGGGGICLNQGPGSGGGGGSSYSEPTATLSGGGGAGSHLGNGSVSIAWGFLPDGGIVPPTTLMRPNKATKVTSCSCGDPVNTATGNLAESFDDLSVPGRGIPLDFSRSYNSLMAGVNGPLGYGWTDSYNLSLGIGTSETVVNQEDGTQLFYEVSGTAWVAPPWVQATLVHNGDGTWTFTRQAAETFVFSSAGQLLSEADRNGVTTTMSYNGSGQLTTVTDHAGRRLSIGWSGGHIVGVTDTASPPRSVSFAYNDANGDLTDVIDAAGGHSVLGYDASHDLTTIRSPKYFGDTTTTPPPVTTNDYDAARRVTAQVDPLGATTTFSYTPTSTTITDPRGNVEVQTFNSGLLYSDTTGAGTAQAATTYFADDPVSLATTEVVDPNANATDDTVDASGNVVSSTDALGRTTRSTYNAFNEPLTVVDPTGVTTTMAYDGAGNLQSSSTPLLNGSGQIVATATTTYHYGDPSNPGDITSVTDPDGHDVTYTYDADGDLSSATDALGDETTYFYDGVGRLTATVSPNGNVTGGHPSAHTTRFTYDALDHLLSEVDPLGHTQVTDRYDANGNLVTATDAAGNTAVSTYNPANEVVAVARADTSTVTYGYDADGNQVTATDGDGHLTTQTYTDAAYPAKATSSTDALGHTTAFSFDADGNLVAKQDPGGNCSGTPTTGCTTYGYDAANQQTSITYSEGTTPNASFGFDADGRRVTMPTARVLPATPTTRWAGCSPPPMATGRASATATTWRDSRPRSPTRAGRGP